MTSSLVLVATPIGNLGDLSPRAVQALSSAALIACEDTRRTGRLLQHAGVTGVPMRRVDEHTEHDAIPALLEVLDRGDDVALVTDAGTPGISDPGERVVRAAVDAGHVVTTVPGPTAAVSALVISGFATGRFVFEGFLARKGEERTRQLAAIGNETRTVVLYESPHRTAATLADLAQVCGPERRAAVARELTKLHEEVRRATLADLAADTESGLKGEVVIVVEGRGFARADVTDDDLRTELEQRLAAGETRRDAVANTVASTGARKGRVYDLALAIPGSVTPPS